MAPDTAHGVYGGETFAHVLRYPGSKNPIHAMSTAPYWFGDGVDSARVTACLKQVVCSELCAEYPSVVKQPRKLRTSTLAALGP